MKRLAAGKRARKLIGIFLLINPSAFPLGITGLLCIKPLFVEKARYGFGGVTRSLALERNLLSAKCDD